MAQVKIGQFKFGEDTFTLRYVLDKDIVKFVAKDIASSLGYEKFSNAVKKYVDIKYKSTYGDQSFKNNVKRGDLLYLQPHTILLSNIGVLQLISRSKMPNAAEFQDWFYDHVLPACLRNRSPVDLMRDAEYYVRLNAEPMLGHVYVATTPAYAEKNLFKVGQTVDLHARLSSLNCGRADFDQMRYVLWTDVVAGHVAAEAVVKRRLAPYKNCNEVFQCDFEHVRRVVEESIKQQSSFVNIISSN
ncbi:baculovirus repeated ORF-a [Anticarsia gemmatalis nucleopolyhedrovirus]|uniref:Baculovirus repeated ORF-a n=1 Tax=Anticarsia gemmatalis multiple nucleopolyhedrovirus TaxID=268591 RepID=A0A0S3J2J6_9ABAC|nr:baculovirus repeated ORF-a [Anticarsia gemmatalis nucleopolyhedrovirus]ABI13790.1 baculovirus repeated ORF-a [Anticarsia gemmatalis multiple nucleopolyhedrovirus]ALR69964.1 baculovirus repeated ORF-a [Anticarsia gemmatalis multiple nucleopolyhedrovirus]ALR70749.1 baculovirus repeated ORF-a [Anticarsia gemmatalis multiple nucleopolyhedrovirus]ALR71380.1 baculovirus repeated ORF-a [Anticarsia gemmatalis multiple nucleopolyhedrovirus]ALR72163.1 baculovirus repeated ORF-a [Anticarsia gemmatalis